MILTRKAAVGFILLAILTFSVATISYQNRVVMPESAAHTNILIPPMVSPYTTNSPETVVVYTSRGINFGEYTPLVMTVVMEVFALVCYIGLKVVEPKIKAWEEKARGPPKGGWNHDLV